jgi:RimJ/RimL family protein N-acetyltransferase
VLIDLWPLYGLALSTGPLVLRLPREEEVADLAELAGRGVHLPGERPFLTPWTDGEPADRARRVLQGHWHALAAWRVEDWQLGLGVFRDGEPLGVVTLRARDFPVVREVTTAAWLGLEHQRRGYGTRARAALLTLAFDHLGARSARTDVFTDNHASQGVSRRLGYEHDGVSVDARDGEALVSDRMRLSRERWRGTARPEVAVHGLDACRSMFGIVRTDG